MALFGEKDFQQLKVIERLALDLDIPIGIVGVPIVRERDGLAMSSRNANLTADERARAPAMHAALERAATSIEAGEWLVPSVARGAVGHRGRRLRRRLCRGAPRRSAAGRRRPMSGRPASWRPRRIGATRLIDNVALDTAGPALTLARNRAKTPNDARSLIDAGRPPRARRQAAQRGAGELGSAGPLTHSTSSSSFSSSRTSPRPSAPTSSRYPGRCS